MIRLFTGEVGVFHPLLPPKSHKKDDKGRYYRVGDKHQKPTLTSAHVEAKKIKATMGNLIYFLTSEYPETVNIENEKLRDTFKSCLNIYLDECRNQSFHRHNTYDWERVDRIRNNTFFIYFILLGACTSKDNAANIEHFAIVADDRLERIYYWLREKEMYTFKVKMSGEKDYYYATRTAEREFPSFDEYGLLDNFSIPIRCTKRLNSPMNESRCLVISRDHIPDELWYTSYVKEYPIDYSL